MTKERDRMQAWIDWFKSVLHDEFEAFIGIFVVIGALLFAGIVGDFFGGIGDRVFGKKKEESNDSPS
jgi:hypothetical protein